MLNNFIPVFAPFRRHINLMLNAINVNLDLRKLLRSFTDGTRRRLEYNERTDSAAEASVARL